MRRFSCNFMPYFFRKLEKMSQNLWPAAVVIEALRVKDLEWHYFGWKFAEIFSTLPLNPVEYWIFKTKEKFQTLLRMGSMLFSELHLAAKKEWLFFIYLTPTVMHFFHEQLFAHSKHGNAPKTTKAK